MVSYKELRNKLITAGKLEKISIYCQLISNRLKLSTKEALDHYRSALQIFKDYLEFDPTPPVTVSDDMLKIFLQIFSACRRMGSPTVFRSAYKEFSLLKEYFNDAELLAELYSQLNYLFWMDNDFDTSLEFGRKCLEKLQECGNDEILPGRYSNIGYIYECQSKFDRAEEYYDLGIQFGLRVNSDRVLCLAYCGFGRINLYAGNYQMAVNYFLEALEFFEEKDDDYISVINNLGIAFGRLERHKEAVEYFSMFLNDATREKNPDAYFDLLMNCANSHLAQDHYDIAHSQLKEALDSALKQKRKDIATGILINLGNLEKRRENWQRSNEYYQESLIYNKEINDIRHTILANLGLGIVNLHLNNISMSKKFLNAALKDANSNKQIPEIIVAHNYLADINESQDEYQEALHHIKLLKDLQLSEKEKKFALDLQQLKLKYKNKEQLLHQYDYKPSLQLISRELAAKINSPLIGQSQEMQKIVDHALIAAQNPNTPVLISGESGTGKEIIARLIHYASERKGKPFVVVNTAAFADSLIESAFFGSEKGAFTGADKRKTGYFEAAAAGSLFLDEIGDMPLSMQVKFLRVLEHKVMNRIGSVEDIPLDFRLISASNKDLYQFTENNQFRFDLLNRINTIEIHIPPLRKRREDIPILINYFLDYFSKDLGITKPVISKSALQSLIAYDYPGNVRELKNIIHRTLMFSQKDVLNSNDIMFSIQENERTDQSIQPTLNLRDNERMLIKKAMDQSNQIQLHAAKLLGISPYALNRKLKKMTEGDPK